MQACGNLSVAGYEQKVAMKKVKQKLSLSAETIKTLAPKELTLVAGGFETGDRESIVYWCPSNTSILRSCSSCGMQ